MKYRLYLFDFDYTLVNSEKGILECFHRSLEEMDYPPAGDDVLRGTIGSTIEDAFRSITGEKDEERIREAVRAYHKVADERMTPGTFFFPESVEVLRELHRRGRKTGIVSTKRRIRILEKFERDGIPELVDHVVGVEDVSEAKPSPEGIKKALEHFGMEPGEALYVGDSPFDAEAAKNAGVDFAGVTTGTTLRETLSEYPHVRIMERIGEVLDIDP